MLVVTGIPLFFLESAFGQFCSQGPINVWRAVPLLQGKTTIKVLRGISRILLKVKMSDINYLSGCLFNYADLFLLSEELVVWFEGFIMCPEIDTTAVIAFLFLFSFFFLTQCPIFLWVKQKPQCHITSLSASPGVGIAMLMVTLIVSIYYNVIIAYSLYYMFASFQSPLPWSSCFSWADSNCSDTPTGASFHLQTCCLSADVLFSRGGVT